MPMASRYTAILGDHGVSLTSVFQPPYEDGDGMDTAEILWITHRVREAQVQAALAALSKLDVVKEIASLIRVEG